MCAQKSAYGPETGLIGPETAVNGQNPSELVGN